MTLRELCSGVGAWLDGTGPRADVVLSSRVRLARNVGGVPFPHRADDLQRQRTFREVTAAAGEAPSLAGACTWNLEDVLPKERRVFVERQLASPRLLGGSGARGVVVASGEGVALQVNEEDHVRIQCVVSGFQLTEALRRAVEVDQQLEALLPYACTDTRGFLTACPTNVGTGLRASVLIHLPGLALAGEIRKVHRAVGEMGMAVRGWFGEGSAALGDFYQLSNQRTLGRTEERTVEALSRVGERVLDLELEAREKLRGTPARRIRVLDRVFRSWGTLRHARLLGVEQLMACASDLRLGRWLGEFQGLRDEVLNGLALFGQPGHLGVRLGQELDEDAERWARAEWVRRQLTGEQEAGSGRPS
jgi:protein arginine kinase